MKSASLYEQGDIYKGSYKGWYCTPCESFWTESQLKDGKCPDCGRDVKMAEEEAYFFADILAYDMHVGGPLPFIKRGALSVAVISKCPDCGRDVKMAEEEAYFFAMSKYSDRLMRYYDEHPEFIRTSWALPPPPRL